MTGEPDQVIIELRSLIARMSPNDIETVSTDEQLVEDLGYDSLMLIELAVAIESQFALSAISEEQAMRIKTVGDLESFIAAHRSAV